MYFNEVLNNYINELGCTAQELAESSGLSASSLSRYRCGERVPEINSKGLEQLCNGIAELAGRREIASITAGDVMESFAGCPDIIATNKQQLRNNLNILISVLNINVTRLCKSISYDTSSVFRIRNGQRQPSEPLKFAAGVAEFVAAEYDSEDDRKILAELLGCTAQELSEQSICSGKIRGWLVEGKSNDSERISGFFSKLNEFDLNEYINTIHFDKLKVPTVPFQLPTSKSYFGLKEMMESELDFLKATVLSKSVEPVTMYSDMPMDEMAKDKDFPKKWMFGMAVMLKKGLHLNMIHNVDRPFSEMMLGLESYIPMYMTGQISPYYIKGVQNNVFMHLLKVSGAAALTGEAITGYHNSGKYYLTKNKEEVMYYKKRAKQMLSCAKPLMDIYGEERAVSLNAFMLSDAAVDGKRRSILSSPPLYTVEPEYLKKLLESRSLSRDKITKILNFAKTQRSIAEKILAKNTIEEEIPYITQEEFNHRPVAMSLSGAFYNDDIIYSYSEYSELLRQTEEFAKVHKNYKIKRLNNRNFINLQIVIHQGEWVMVSKEKSPAIHFIIHHPKLREAIENYVPPLVE